MTIRVLVSSVCALVAAVLLGTTSHAACIADTIGSVGCPSGLTTDPPTLWLTCGQVRVDINKKTFNSSAHKNCWYDAIHDNAMDGWNDAYQSPFHQDLLVEVPGSDGNYDIQYNMVPQSTYMPKWGKISNTAVTESKANGSTVCCGSVRALVKAKIYVNKGINWSCNNCPGSNWGGHARFVAVHELGHGIGLIDETNKSTSFDSVMDFNVCLTWPGSDDGRAVFCNYALYRQCQCGG